MVSISRKNTAIRGVFKINSKIYDGMFLRKQLAAKNRELLSQKRSIVDIRQGSKYAYGDGVDMCINLGFKTLNQPIEEFTL